MVRPASKRSVWYVAALLLAVFTYFYALDSQYIPRNGDEDVYAHITRLTAHSDHLLPLQSDLVDMRNTKPPLLFWQGIASTHWAAQWDWWHLRYPSVIYTLLTAWLVLLLGKKSVRTGPRRAISRHSLSWPFSAPTAGGAPSWSIRRKCSGCSCRSLRCCTGDHSASNRAGGYRYCGIEVGIGLLYKSFALLAPVGLVLAWWYLHERRYQWREFISRDAAKPVLTGGVALSLFALWFVFDPDPQAVWREFVVGENASKFDAHGGSYLAQLLWGGSSVWALLLGYPMNAGLLAFPVAAWFFVAYRRRMLLNDAEKMVWIWMAVLFVVFAVPSQRSARYLLEAMPGVALLCALLWHRIPRWVFIASLVSALAVLALLALLALRLQREVGGLYDVRYWLLTGATVVLAAVAMFREQWTRDLTSVVALLTMLGMAVFLRPFDGPLGSFDDSARRHVQGKDVWVSCNFRAQDEGYRFLLPGAQVHGYNENWRLGAEELAARYALFAVELPLQAEVCQGCTALGSRLKIRGRHSSEELRDMLSGDVFRHLFVREWLLESTQVNAENKQSAEGCR